ncbi:hypothetical protein AURDEDRAFT_128331 [Auricularia subglabra TFB-10046 SS5]|nr:hypothetical protein AURDEDRAFT_128331 [Auricularia subglabra TFB-10046 SS5]
MSFIDFPTPTYDPVGGLVVVALDPVASLGLYRDPVVNRLAREVVTQRRLVIFDFPLVYPLHLLGADVRRHRFHVVRTGLPAKPWASTPISPSTTHPEGRVPVCPSKPVPVADPYVHSLFTFEGTVSRIYTDNPSDIRFTLAETRRICQAQFWDNERHKQEEKEAAAAEDDDCSSDSGDDDYDSDSELEPVSYIEPYYIMWKCVDPNEAYAEPETLEDEMEQLRSIEANWRERMKDAQRGKGERLDAWLRSVSVEQGAHDEPSECNPDECKSDENRHSGGAEASSNDAFETRRSGSASPAAALS